MSDPEYVPRFSSKGIAKNPYWYSRNPFYQAGYGLPNCTCYAWGRFWENADINNDYSNRPLLSTGNAEDWFNYNDGYDRGTEPELGAVACYADGQYSGNGHVAIVEEIDSDHAVVSQSAWNGSFFYLTNIALDGTYPYGNYRFQGFIYNPIVGGKGGKGKKKKKTNKIWLFQKELWTR